MNELSKIIADCALKAFDLETPPSIQLSRPDSKFGDFATSLALQLAKGLNLSPKDVAEKLAAALRESGQFAEVLVAGPGFINLRLSDQVLIDQLSPKTTAQNQQTVVIETNNPNPFKAMHIGHAANAIVADTIANLLTAGGAKVYRVSYHGDVGLHVGKSMYSLLKFVAGDAQKLESIKPSERNKFMSQMYAEGSKAYKEDDGAKAEIDELAKQSFSREDALYAKVYDTCKAWSFEQIDEIVAALGNQPIERRFLESEADARGVPIVKANTPKVFKQSDGALIFEGSKFGSFDNAFVSSSGLGLYGARDLGLMQLKNEQYHPSKSYIITGKEQADYFKGVLAAAAQIWPDQADVTINIPTGLVKLSTGKMSSRSGEVVEIEWLFDKLAEAVKARGGEPNNQTIAGALRYQFLKTRVGSDTVFDIASSVSLQGNSGSYLQYAHARAKSILAKSSEQPVQPSDLQSSERELVLKLGEFNEVLGKAVAELMPHHICTYLYELAQEFNRFYESNRVINDSREAERLWLVESYAQTLKNGLNLLGIDAPEHL